MGWPEVARLLRFGERQAVEWPGFNATSAKSIHLCSWSLTKSLSRRKSGSWPPLLDPKSSRLWSFLLRSTGTFMVRACC